MENKKRKILVVFVEPMLYIMDLIRDVYEKTPYEFQFVFCYKRATGRDSLSLPEGTVVCHGSKRERKKQIREVFQSFHPDFAVINGYVGTVQTEAISCCRKGKIPFAVETDTPLHIPGNKMKAFAKKQYLKLLIGHPLSHGFPGGTLQKENLVYYGIPEEKCFVMPMCVSAERLRAEADRLPEKAELKERFGLTEKKVFLFVGRLEQVKNIPVLLRAFEAYKKEHSDAALMIVGDGEEAAALKQMAAQTGTADVFFAGYVCFPELAAYYRVADVFVLPSDYEPWGLVVNEAQALDLPVVVSSHVGCRVDLVIEGETGFVFENDDAAMLKDAMEKAMKLGQPNVRMAEWWNHGVCLDRFIDAVEQICERK